MFLFATPDSNRYGYSKCLRLMVDYLLCDTYEHGWDNRHYLKTHTLSNLEKDLRKHLATNANGLWEYSPYLCGEGLAEALQLAYLANWNASRIPDTEIALGSHLAYHRLQKARRIIDPETGNVQLEETVLVQRHVEGGFDKRELLLRMSKIRHTLDVIHAAIESKSNAWFITPREHSELTGLLGPAKEDLINDICGSFPLSGMDFMQMGIFIGTTICHFEKVLEQHGNKLFKEAYLPGAPWAFMKKAKLLNLALQGNDEECLKAMAGQMQMKFLLDYSLVYWENVEHPRERLVRKVLKTYNMETVEEFLNYFKQEFLDKLL
ncbi:hypothetical protein K4K60_005312 [Colletotrichum sp. SAR11_57]|nr:hypothetical protein K4K60_005312 [Colletotrichum sp. SAR11_57]